MANRGQLCTSKVSFITVSETQMEPKGGGASLKWEEHWTSRQKFIDSARAPLVAVVRSRAKPLALVARYRRERCVCRSICEVFCRWTISDSDVVEAAKQMIRHLLMDGNSVARSSSSSGSVIITIIIIISLTVCLITPGNSKPTPSDILHARSATKYCVGVMNNTKQLPVQRSTIGLLRAHSMSRKSQNDSVKLWTEILMMQKTSRQIFTPKRNIRVKSFPLPLTLKHQAFTFSQNTVTPVASHLFLFLRTPMGTVVTQILRLDA